MNKFKRTVAEQIYPRDREFLMVVERQSKTFLNKFLSCAPEASEDQNRVQRFAEEQYKACISLQKRGKMPVRTKLKVFRNELYFWETVRTNQAKNSNVDVMFQLFDELALLCEANLNAVAPLGGQRPFTLLKELQRCVAKLVYGKRSKNFPRLRALALRHMRAYMGAELPDAVYRSRGRKWLVLVQPTKVTSWKTVLKKSSRRCKSNISSLLWTILDETDQDPSEQDEPQTKEPRSLRSLKSPRAASRANTERDIEFSKPLLEASDTPADPISLLLIQPSVAEALPDPALTTVVEEQEDVTWDDNEFEVEVGKDALESLDDEIITEPNSSTSPRAKTNSSSSSQMNKQPNRGAGGAGPVVARMRTAWSRTRSAGHRVAFGRTISSGNNRPIRTKSATTRRFQEATMGNYSMLLMGESEAP